MIDVAILLSVGRHPASGRPRRAPLDARALELALRIPDARLHAVHAGDPTEPALRDYLGMGLDRLSVIETPAGHDPLPALADHLATVAPAFVLAGCVAEGGEDGGLLPYAVARRLGYGLVPDVAGVTVAGDHASLTQALPRGRRRLVEARLPLVATIHPAAPEPRQSAFARGRRGVIEVRTVPTPEDAFLADCEAHPWRPRPKRMRLPAGGSALERLKAATEAKSGEGRVMVGPSPDEAARAIYEYLVEKRIISGVDVP